MLFGKFPIEFFCQLRNFCKNKIYFLAKVLKGGLRGFIVQKCDGYHIGFTKPVAVTTYIKLKVDQFRPPILLTPGLTYRRWIWSKY